MQFVANGPDIPDALLQDHEDGHVVLFCGAGISYPAGLPGFAGLVDRIFSLASTTRSAIEQAAFDRQQFDATLDLLERRLPGGRFAVRKQLHRALQPKLRSKGASETHRALLQLAKTRDGSTRLVTTNFDRIFSKLVARAKPSVSAYPAPLLPLPKNSRWNGIVYLHGLMPESVSDESALNRLVLTSGDFGLAYLTERWAARFVSELFRNYIVCFVGYSINDPVMRYMMDALAADRMLGEVTPQAYAFGDYAPGKEQEETVGWKAKGVTPILYEVPVASHDHSALHRTLKAWAETYRDGTHGKERIVVDHAMARPTASTQQDNFVGRMLWALSDKSGLPAKRFAEIEPTPPFEWMEALAGERLGHADLNRFNVYPGQESSDVAFSLISRPAPFALAPRMRLVSSGTVECEWDAVMFQLARWLERHLNDPALILWLAASGGRLHKRLAWRIQSQLDHLDQLFSEGKTDELARISSHSPNGIPCPLLRPIWRLLLAGRVKLAEPGYSDFHRWLERLRSEGLTADLRFRLRQLLAPVVVLRQPVRWSEPEVEVDPPVHLEQLVDWELVLAAGHIRAHIANEDQGRLWEHALPKLQADLQQLLIDALDILSELGEADAKSDRSYWYLPSICHHWQNRRSRDWVVLIELVRDAWLAIREDNPSQAKRLASEWLEIPYATFKRLALFAASQDSLGERDDWVDLLTADNGWWLWASDTRRETLRLLVLRGNHLTPAAQQQLVEAILRGPPRTRYADDLEQSELESLIDHAIWLRLRKLQSSGLQLSAVALDRLASISLKYPLWQISENERDEFSSWISGTGDPDFEDRGQVDVAPPTRTELVKWLRKPPRSGFRESDTWQETCRTHFSESASALIDLAGQDEWPIERWGQAFQVWSEETLASQSWEILALPVENMPDETLKGVSHSITWWLEAVSKSMEQHQTVFLRLCERILRLSPEDESDNDQPLMRAINHPIGRVTQALLDYWFSLKPNDKDGLPGDLQTIFTELCDSSVVRFRHARALMASRLIALYRVDQTWTDAYLLPLFEWATDAAEARAVWEGFLWSPRLHQPLFVALKYQFLDTARRYADLGEHARQFVTLLTYVALELPDTYTLEDFREAFAALPQQGLNEAAEALVQALEGAGEQREEYWANRVQPFWRGVWPKHWELASESISESFARLAIAAGTEFPAALAAVLDWLQPIPHLHFVLGSLNESGLPGQFPDEALTLLNAIISNQPWDRDETRKCLLTIANRKPALMQTANYQRLSNYCE